ncbi:DsbA family oxidoreductase [Aliifodinibius sp. S!AR15-10]|uniref:DsbA family oxidoreductase n=1 Tax=Aliifodinibius sp. S!AR15-10 TaxID=2950437 RepID=UPI002854CE33|nr:DsbA family oxidoreductase [Aliifodinibius sp. S!AR15-10]MDR8394362.1 DsbA family oxidoreductase [Aliifodinibius sp. S!AR15-10]
MKIEIWSDICCPFCYIGKRHLEQAIDKFEHKDEVEVTWHSFELDTGAEINPDQNVYEMLADKYGQSLEWARKANEDLKEKAAAVGIDFNPEAIIPTNSFDAHRLIKLATRHGLADEAEEKLFAAYFTQGRHIAQPETLKQIGLEIGLDASDLDELLAGDDFADAVRADEKEAQKIGIRGVPFFVLNRKYAVSGAQPVHMFTEALEKAYNDEQADAVGQQA